MSGTFVIHWCDPTHRVDGKELITGDTAACVRAVMSGDGYSADEITKIEWYDTDEGISQVVPLEDIARAVANAAGQDQATGGDGITAAIRDFVHSHAGLAWARGLRLIDTTFQAA